MTSQKDTIDWFNKTYSEKGESYLRPIDAYYIYLELLQAKPGDKLIDIACGLGRLLEAAQPYQCQLHGIDISDVAVEKASKKLPEAKISNENAETISYQNNSFDLITCIGSLERMHNLDNVLAELQRIGNDNAKYCFLVRNSNTLIWKIFKDFLGMRNKKGHQGAKSLEEWKRIFANAGFTVEAVYPDQYPLHKAKKISTLGLMNVNYKKRVASLTPLEYANEFLFVLTKDKS